MTAENVLEFREKSIQMAEIYRRQCEDPQAENTHHILFAIWTGNVLLAVLAELLWETKT